MRIIFLFFHELSDSNMVRSNKFLRAIHYQFLYAYGLFSLKLIASITHADTSIGAAVPSSQQQKEKNALSVKNKKSSLGSIRIDIPSPFLSYAHYRS